MKLDFLKSLSELGPCGLRPIIDTLNDTCPAMAFSDWKNLCLELIDEGFVVRQGNGQNLITREGKEAIAKGMSFFDDDLPEVPTASLATGRAPKPSHQPEVDEELESELDKASKSLSVSVSRTLVDMTTDEIISECHLNGALINSLRSRYSAATKEIRRRVGDLI